MRFKYFLSLILLVSCSALAETGFSSPSDVHTALNKFCFSCHDEDVQKGKVRLDNLQSLKNDDRLDLLNKIQEQVYFRQMPPKKKKKQPTDIERKMLTDWAAVELKKFNASKLADKMRYPDYGNYVDHDMLFSGDIKDKAYTPARRWLVSPQIFTDRVMNVLTMTERDRRYYAIREMYGVTNPFVLNDSSGVRYYDNSLLEGGHLLVMLTNAEWMAGKQIFGAVQHGKNHRNVKHVNPKDKWYPKNVPDVYAKIVNSDAKPSQEDMTEAITKQFKLALCREPDERELSKYLALLSSSIELGGNAEGLKQMLKSVILESEFLYRMEFGGGPADEFGRKKLKPLEAAFAISYAIGDRQPDAKILKAAAEGKLLTKEDYRREAQRLLNDEKYYAFPIDPVITKKSGPLETYSHPKLIRFFREFFGYDKAYKVFKDNIRSDGYYKNAGRGSAGTGGTLMKEADMLVKKIVTEDKDVFKRILTTEKYFVADVEDAPKKMAFLKEMYERFKDTDWKKSAEEILKNEEHVKFIRSGLTWNAGAKQLKTAMTHAEKFIKKGLTPHPVWNYSFGRNLTLQAKSYNISPFDWEYPKQQPFKVANRKGILTHPAWLIAHSHNAETDPVKRGRWIREKLLAGRVPDVPITVDAKVPENPHKTLRERFDDVTMKQECWKCHQYMNPLGYPFEIYDDFGRFRTEERLEYEENIIAKPKGKYNDNTYKTKPVIPNGELDGTGIPNLDGKVENALDMIDRLGQSRRVQQSIIRHAFRFYMGRNEMLSDSQTLIDAEEAYIKSGGSFKAMVISLITSDSFIYRK